MMQKENLRQIISRIEKLEKAVFAITHDDVMMLLLKQWSLPQSLGNAIGHHHQTDGQNSTLAQVLFASDWVNAVFCVAEMNPVLGKVRNILTTEFGLTEAEVEQQLAELPAAVMEAADALGLHIPTQTDFDQLLRQANTRLAKENTGYQELTWQLEKAIAERDRLAAWILARQNWQQQ